LSSSSDDQWEFCELIRAADEARQHYSDATREVGGWSSASTPLG
jgi:hypothetical protein